MSVSITHIHVSTEHEHEEEEEYADHRYALPNNNQAFLIFFVLLFVSSLGVLICLLFDSAVSPSDVNYHEAWKNGVEVVGVEQQAYLDVRKLTPHHNSHLYTGNSPHQQQRGNDASSASAAASAAAAPPPPPLPPNYTPTIYGGISTIPQRMATGMLHRAVTSLLLSNTTNHTFTKVVVTLPLVDRSGNKLTWDTNLVQTLQDLDKQRIIIHYHPEDYGPLCKLLGALVYAPPDAFILLIDDDTVYHPELPTALLWSWDDREQALRDAGNTKAHIASVGHSGRNGLEFHWDAQLIIPKRGALIENYCGGLYKASSFNITALQTWVRSPEVIPEAFFNDDIVIGAWLHMHDPDGEIWVMPHHITQPENQPPEKHTWACEHDPGQTATLSSGNGAGRNMQIWSSFLDHGFYDRATVPIAII